VGAGEKMNLVFACMVTAGAAAMIPEVPVLHHVASSKEATNMGLINTKEYAMGRLRLQRLTKEKRGKEC
jgi:hypothetical protein